MTRLSVLPDAEAVARHTADAMAWRIADARHVGREVHIAVAGGRTPKRSYELLGLIEGSWDHVHIWLCDERCVPHDDERSNARMVRESLIAAARTSPATFHVVRAVDQPADAAWLYGLEISTRVPELTFDIVLLGLGEDGHVASLFPGHPEVRCEHTPCVGVIDSPKPPAERVSMTIPLLRRARHTILIVTGEEKADALAKLRAKDESIPATHLGDGLDEIVCDRAAAGQA